MDWAKPQDNEKSLWNAVPETKKNIVCLVVPGLSGGENEGYLMALVRTLLSDGYDVVVYNARGLGKTEYTSVQFANLTHTEEFERTF